MNYSHTPVLLQEVLEYLAPRPGENFVDATLGGGGYTSALAELVGPKGKVLAMDLDAEAIKNFERNKKQSHKNVKVVHGNFTNINKAVLDHKILPVNGIVADIGLSSFQLETSGRGISFQKTEPLDMRFDQSSDGPDAKFILNNKDERELAEIFSKLGEEKFSRQIARRIARAREEGKVIKYTTDLYKTIESSLPKPVRHKARDSARRVFQALRIAVNHELESLEAFLPKAFDILAPGGRLVIVSFHSLEDRIVKRYFQGLSKGCVCPTDFPECRCGKDPRGRILTKKPVIAGEAELKNNPRSKPAKLRAIIKI